MLNTERFLFFMNKLKFKKSISIIFCLFSISLLLASSESLAAGPALSGSCFTNPSSIIVGQSVTWLVDVGGGDGLYSYSYLWSGSDNLNGQNSSMTKVYNTPGIKTATVRIRSGSQQIFRNCSVVVETGTVSVSGNLGLNASNQSVQGANGHVLGESAIADPFIAGCVANKDSVEIGENIFWTALVPSDFKDKSSYSWSGSDNLSGQTESVSVFYKTMGVKTAAVVVSSGEKQTTANCSIDVIGKGGVIPVVSGSASVNNLPEVGIVPLNWRILSYLILIIGGLVLLSFVLVLRKQRNAERQKMSLAYSESIKLPAPEDKNKKEISEIIQSEARERKVLVSADALNLLVEKSGGDSDKAIKCLDCVVSEMKEPPYSTIPGEERLPVVDKDEVEKCFLRNKDL